MFFAIAKWYFWDKLQIVLSKRGKKEKIPFFSQQLD